MQKKTRRYIFGIPLLLVINNSSITKKSSICHLLCQRFQLLFNKVEPIFNPKWRENECFIFVNKTWSFYLCQLWKIWLILASPCNFCRHLRKSRHRLIIKDLNEGTAAKTLVPYFVISRYRTERQIWCCHSPKILSQSTILHFGKHQFVPSQF